MSGLFASPAGKNTSSLFIRDSVIWVDIAGICIPCRLMVISTFVPNKRGKDYEKVFDVPVDALGVYLIGGLQSGG